MKRKLAVLMCGLMCATAFTGCSSTELAYLKMSSDMMDTMAACRVEGKMQADIDFDAMEDFMADISEAVYGEGYPGAESETGLSGKKAVTVDYDMNMNIDTLEYDMSFDVTYEGKTYDLGTMYYSMNKGVYVTDDTMLGMYQLAEDFADGYENHYIFSDDFKKEVKAALAEENYIELVSMEYLTGVDMESAVPEQNMAEVYDAALNFYEDVLDGFETGMVKQVNGGYQIEAGGREAAQLLADLMYFIAENPEQVIDATETYMMAVIYNVEAGTHEETELAKQEMAAMFAEARASQDDFIMAANQFAMIIEQMMADVSVGMVLDSFEYTATVKQVGDGFDAVTEYNVTHEGKNVCRLATESTTKSAPVNVNFPTSGMTADELEAKLAALEDKYNPVTGVSISWGWYGESDYADLRMMREERKIFGSDYDWTEMTVEDGRAYLPLRVIAEALGEKVGWEKDTKTPYVWMDGQRIAMKGKLQDDRAFVGIRDFEKLGYTVEYNAYEDGFKTVDITK
ncbi:MAG: copper amine oxidase N-terminal domain-containing protein [Anaerotignum sp.]|nr:copper amine oxidase N-terminal domain-containing protein [Anaerotignum sp.]